MNESAVESPMNITMLKAKRTKPTYPPHAMRRRSQVFVTLDRNRMNVPPRTVWNLKWRFNIAANYQRKKYILIENLFILTILSGIFQSESESE